MPAFVHCTAPLAKTRQVCISQSTVLQCIDVKCISDKHSMYHHTSQEYHPLSNKHCCYMMMMMMMIVMMMMTMMMMMVIMMMVAIMMMVNDNESVHSDDDDCE